MQLLWFLVQPVSESRKLLLSGSKAIPVMGLASSCNKKKLGGGHKVIKHASVRKTRAFLCLATDDHIWSETAKVYNWLVWVTKFAYQIHERPRLHNLRFFFVEHNSTQWSIDPFNWFTAYAWFLRVGAPVFCKPLTYLFNLSLNSLRQ